MGTEKNKKGGGGTGQKPDSGKKTGLGADEGLFLNRLQAGRVEKEKGKN